MTPLLHFGPARGWFNDPNGLIDHLGVHHLFFQHNPRSFEIADMCWGHASSTDLLTWTEHPVALTPGPPGSCDGDGCWSGCAVADSDGVLVLYSGNNAGTQLPCVARALDDDLIEWDKSPANPVVATRPPIDGLTDMRDHSVRRDGRLWRQVLAAGADGEGMLVGYSSPDLFDWTFDGIVLRARDIDLPGQTWECPDVFVDDHQPDADLLSPPGPGLRSPGHGSAVAIISVMAGEDRPVLWLTGEFDGPRFVPQRWGLADHGDRLYAPQSYRDHTGRRIMFGWLRTQLDPAALGEPGIGVASLPRVLSVVDGRLHQRPAGELAQWRGHPTTAGPAETELELDPVAALEVHLTWESTAALLRSAVEFSDEHGRALIVELSRFAVAEQVLTPEGWQSEHPAARSATLVFDAGIVEVFLDDGRAAAVTDVRLETIARIRLLGRDGGSTAFTAWPLTRPTGA